MTVWGLEGHRTFRLGCTIHQHQNARVFEVRHQDLTLSPSCPYCPPCLVHLENVPSLSFLAFHTVLQNSIIQPSRPSLFISFLNLKRTPFLLSLSQILRGIQEGDLISPDLSLLFIQRLFGLGWKLFLLQCLHLCTSLAVVYALMLFLFLPWAKFL